MLSNTTRLVYISLRLLKLAALGLPFKYIIAALILMGTTSPAMYDDVSIGSAFAKRKKKSKTPPPPPMPMHEKFQIEALNQVRVVGVLQEFEAPTENLMVFLEGRDFTGYIGEVFQVFRPLSMEQMGMAPAQDSSQSKMPTDETPENDAAKITERKSSENKSKSIKEETENESKIIKEESKQMNDASKTAELKPKPEPGAVVDNAEKTATSTVLPANTKSELKQAMKATMGFQSINRDTLGFYSDLKGQVFIPVGELRIEQSFGQMAVASVKKEKSGSKTPFLKYHGVFAGDVVRHTPTPPKNAPKPKKKKKKKNQDIGYF